MLAKDITKDMRCNVCGGDGHTASFITAKGEKVLCPKIILFGRQKDNPSTSNVAKQNMDSQYRSLYKKTEGTY